MRILSAVFFLSLLAGKSKLLKPKVMRKPPSPKIGIKLNDQFEGNYNSNETKNLFYWADRYP